MWYENLTLVQNIFSVLAMIGVGAVCLYRGNIGQAKKIALSLVIEAEQKFGNGTGDLKYSYVLGYVYSKLPATVRIFVSEKVLEVIIEEAVRKMKEICTDDTVDSNGNKDASSIVLPADSQSTVTPITNSQETQLPNTANTLFVQSPQPVPSTEAIKEVLTQIHTQQTNIIELIGKIV